MKKSKYHIISSWILLTCFVAGQYMVYSHQHNVPPSTFKIASIFKTTQQQTFFKEKCALCDVMHHSQMVVSSTVYFRPAVVNVHYFEVLKYGFTSSTFILAGGRAPPSSNNS